MRFTALMNRQRFCLVFIVPAIMFQFCSSVAIAHDERKSEPGRSSGKKGAPAGTAKVLSDPDPYLLDIDPVSGASLGPPSGQVVTQYQGRELRFSSQTNSDLFMKNPAKYVPELDRKLIDQQVAFYPLNSCVVSGKTLGGETGPPVNYLYGNRLVRFDSRDCVSEFEENPEEYLTTLDEAVVEAQRAAYGSTTCVVSGKELGEMGDPAEIVVGNRLVRFCCAGCKKTFAKDRISYMQKLPLPAIAAKGKTK